MKQITVQLKENSYNIIIQSGALANVAELLHTKAEKIFVISDDNVEKLYLHLLIDNLKAYGFNVGKFVFPSGEKSKTLQTVSSIYEKMAEFALTRSDLVIAFGGGVVGDVAGFAAATYLRGVSYVQIPTTLLAQVDSSVGGKVAVDLPQGKNLVGRFYQPNKVIIDTDLLNSLSDKYFADGMAEVIKYGCIKSNELFEELVKYGGRVGVMKNIEKIVASCCEIKAEIVARDEKDLGERMLLNFGHTYGHALEKFYNFTTIGHGEAVACGMYYITKISEKNNQTVAGTAEKIKDILTMYNLPSEDKADCKKVIVGIASDKKHINGQLKIVLISNIGGGYLLNADNDYFK